MMIKVWRLSKFEDVDPSTPFELSGLIVVMITEGKVYLCDDKELLECISKLSVLFN